MRSRALGSPPAFPHILAWHWADLRFWDMADDAPSAVLWLRGFSECCPSMWGCGLENPQAPAATLSSCPTGQPHL